MSGNGRGKKFEIDEEMEKELFGDWGDNQDEEEEEGEDLFDDGLLTKDYEYKPHLDKYDEDILDEAQYEPMPAATRHEAELAMNKRDRGTSDSLFTGGAGSRKRPHSDLSSARMPAMLHDDGDDDDDDNNDEEWSRMTTRRNLLEQAATGAINPQAIEDQLNDIAEIEKKGPVREWVQMEAPRRHIAKKFHSFLSSFVDDKGNAIYTRRISEMCAANKESLFVGFPHLSKAIPNVAMYLADAPAEVLTIFKEVALEVVLAIFPEYKRIHGEVHVRITDLPIQDSLRDLRQHHLNSLIRVAGVVTRRTGVFPQLKYAKYDCGKCGAVLGPFFQGTTTEIKVQRCTECEGKGPFTINTEQTAYRNYQKITLQESPGTVPAGRLPRTKDVILLADMIDCASPGEEIEVIGVYRNNFDASLNTKNGFPVFATIIEANCVTKKEDLYASFLLTPEDQAEIIKLSKDPRIGERIIASIAPSIYGHEDVKTALALALFGGECKEFDKQKHRVRGDINVLLVGDPGTAKSQFLKYAEKTAHRAVYTTGQGASAVGLTAAVCKDPITGEWILEGGALVLADKGVCMIDEFDKMTDKDRTSIHEAMEQQSISISKAGIVTTLLARCTIIAAANPIGGRYRPALSFAQNVELTEPIMSRFDILCVVRDTVDPIVDEALAEFVVGSHMNSHPHSERRETTHNNKNEDGFALSQELLRKYITYARSRCHPKLRNIDRDKVENLYAQLRTESLVGGVCMTVRHLESMLRMSEAHAKMHLRDYVNDDDVNVAIRVMLESFISSQKFAISRSMKKKFRGYISFKRDNEELLLHLLQTMVRERSLHGNKKREEVNCSAFETRAREMDLGTTVHHFYQTPLFTKNGFVRNPDRNVITWGTA